MAGLLERRKPTRGLLDVAKYGDGGLLSSYEPSLRDKVNYWLADHWYGDTRQGVEQAKNLSNVLETVTPYGLLTGAYDAGRSAGSGDYLGAGIAGAMTALPLPAPVEKEAKQGIRAFHGSPHSFDRFSMDKIGTGEGAQVYGHGLYFAENENIAKSYRDNLSPTWDSYIDGKKSKEYDKKIWDVADQIASRGLTPEGFLAYRNEQMQNALKVGNEKRAKLVQEIIDEERPIVEQLIGKNVSKGPGGSMYEVRINANPDDFLDWDKPLSEQPPHIQKAWEKIKGSKIGALADKSSFGDISKGVGKYENPTGNALYSALTEGLIGYGKARPFQQVKTEASQRLAKQGIPGIKYLDAGSRTPIQNDDLQRQAADLDRKIANARKESANMPYSLRSEYEQHIAQLEQERRAVQKKLEPTRNYVVFDDNLIEIVRKYGIAGASALLGYNFMQELTPAQQNQLKMIEG